MLSEPANLHSSLDYFLTSSLLAAMSFRVGNATRKLTRGCCNRWLLDVFYSSNDLGPNSHLEARI